MHFDEFRFDPAQLPPDKAGGNVGDLFQRFCYDVLRPEYTDLQYFPGGGRDGAIDLYDVTGSERRVVECKYIGADDFKTVQQRWREVAKKLESNLESPAGPPPTQPQYAPWYRTDAPIREYLFCTSVILKNPRQFDDLRDEISAFFVGLAGSRAHLGHFAAIRIEVVGWYGLLERTRDRPHVLYSWFPKSRPLGLVPLDDVTLPGAFAAYLSSAKLPYYSPTDHARNVPPPPGFSVPDEEALIREIETAESSGLVVTGGGGVGKTRLMLEIGLKARTMDWTVLRATGRLRKEAIASLATRITDKSRVLLVIDYIETQPEFFDVDDLLNELNDTYFYKIRYVANCRGSYYGNVEGKIRHLKVDLSAGSEAESDWLAGYRERAVRHILESRGVGTGGSNLEICRDLPVLAVFLAFLADTGRGLQLAELREEKDFGGWVARRLDRSFPGANRERDIALVMALFPMPSAATAHPRLASFQACLDTLSTDGWIERARGEGAPSDEHWRTAHDVLADQVVLSYVRRIPHRVDAFATELLSLAEDVGCLRSALLSAQRLVDQPEISAVDWGRVIADRMDAAPESWRDVRAVVLRTPLLSIPQIVDLLGRHDAVWEGAESEADFQNTLGWLIRSIERDSKDPLDPDRRDVVLGWLRKASAKVTTSNYLLTQGLWFAPDVVRDHAQEWIFRRPSVYQTHYLLAAWLSSGLPVELIDESALVWMRRFRQSFHASFVYRAWLKAGGELDVMRVAVLEWLALHKTLSEAQFVYAAWLDAGGELDAVRAALVEWLVQNKTAFDADFVLKAYLKAGGSFANVKEAALDWLHEHWNQEEAVYLTKFIAKQPDLPTQTVKDILGWCRTFNRHEDALWRLTSLKRNLANPDAAGDVVDSAEAVIRPFLSPDMRTSHLTISQLSALFWFLIAALPLRDDPFRAQVNRLFLEWLRTPSSFQERAPSTLVQRRPYLQRVIDLVRDGALDLEADRAPLQKFVRWIDRWDSEQKMLLYDAFSYLQRKHSAPEIWDLFELDDREDERDFPEGC